MITDGTQHKTRLLDIIILRIEIVGGAVASVVSALDSGSSGPGSRPSREHCLVFMGKTLHSHSASLHPGVYWVPANLMLGGGEPCNG